VGFVQEIGSDEIAANRNLARADVRGFRQDVFDLIVEKKPGHQRGLHAAKPFENGGLERDDHDASDLLGFAKSADERMLPSPEPIGLQFKVENDIVLAGKFQDFDERGDALAHEFAAKPGAGIEAANFGECHALNGALTGSGSVDGLVVESDEVRVASEMKIGLNESDAQRGGAAEGSKGVLRGVTGSSAMSNGKHGRENLLRKTQYEFSGSGRDSLSYANTVGVGTQERSGAERREAKYGAAGMRAMRRMGAAVMATMMSLLLVAAQVAGQGTEKHPKVDENLSRAVHHQLQMLPYYSVFDNLTYTIDGSKVTLSGQVVRPTLKEHAEAAVKSIEGVLVVVNTIEVLPRSPADDELRREVYRVIFEDGELKQYAVEPVPTIHIIVKNGAVTLEGSVNSNGDKELARTKAGSVEGVQKLANHLVVHEKETAAK
jgi:osmotically-inducible protein OsmY